MGDGRFKEEIHVSTSNTLNVQINLTLETIPVCQFSYLKGSNAIMDRIQIYARVSTAIFQEDHGWMSWFYKMINTILKKHYLIFSFSWIIKYGSGFFFSLLLRMSWKVGRILNNPFSLNSRQMIPGILEMGACYFKLEVFLKVIHSIVRLIPKKVQYLLS